MVRLTLFGPVQDEVLEGVPDWRGGRLWLQTADGSRVSFDIYSMLQVDLI